MLSYSCYCYRSWLLLFIPPRLQRQEIIFILLLVLIVWTLNLPSFAVSSPLLLFLEGYTCIYIYIYLLSWRKRHLYFPHSSLSSLLLSLLSLSLSFFFIHPSIHPSTHQHTHPSIYIHQFHPSTPSIKIPIHSSIYCLPIHPSIHQHTNTSINIPTRLPICLPIHSFIINIKNNHFI